jgi:hypothetical protein
MWRSLETMKSEAALEKHINKNVLLPRKLAICVTCHFREDRIPYLNGISDFFSELAEAVEVTIVTNTMVDNEIGQIEKAINNKGFQYSFFTPVGLGHPYLLTWSHFDVFRKKFEDHSITHFMYLEDDILINKKNILYWMKARQELKSYNFIPSFLRYEKRKHDSVLTSVDCHKKMNFDQLPKLIYEDVTFINLEFPYQGMYLLDRELMAEHLRGITSSPDSGVWHIRERAAQGVTFANVPTGFFSRNLIPYDVANRRIDHRCLIYHTPNNWVNDLFPKELNMEAIPLDDLLIFENLRPKIDTPPTIGRNAPCPCGSGKRYKHCHGSLI